MDDKELNGLKIDVHIAEYEALRTEIEWLIKDGTMYQNLVFTLMGVVIAAEGWIYQNAPNLVIPVLLVIPFLFSLLGYLYIRQHEEVYIIASYLKDNLRPKLRKLLGDEELWQWEEFKSKKTDKFFNKGKMRFITSDKMITILRAMLFVLPSFIAIILITVYVLRGGIKALETNFGDGLIYLFLMLYFIDLLVFLSFIVFMIFRSNLRKRFEI
jgi:hypothetical protein